MPFNRIYLPNIDRISNENYIARLLKTIAIRNYGRTIALDKATTYQEILNALSTNEVIVVQQQLNVFLEQLKDTPCTHQRLMQ